jgi:hypothetical protein
MAIDRTNYNALVDDDGSNTVGTAWTKNQVKIVLLDPIDVDLALKATLASPTLTGTPAAPTASPGTTSTTQIATTAFVQSALAVGQIPFPATQNPSAGANVLDDYEEATWTPTITGSGGASGQVYSVQAGIYTKIGRMVTAQFSLTLSTLGTITGSVQIGGLPFTNGTGTFNCDLFWDAMTTAYVKLSAQVTSGVGAATLFGSTTTAINHLSTGLVQANLSATTTLRGVLIYMV